MYILRTQKQVIVDGNSLTQKDGTNADLKYRMPLTLFTTLRTNNKIFGGQHYGVTGKRTSQLITDFPTKIAPYLRVGDIVVLWEITNDIGSGGVTAQQAYDNVVTYVNLVRALGAKCVVVGFIARDYVTDAADVITRGFACNALLAANPSFYDAFVDIGANAAFDTRSDASNTTYYNADKIHLTNVGYDLVATLIEPTINALI